MQCISSLSSQLDNLDGDFRKDIQIFIELVIMLKEKMKCCIDENIAAINERMIKLPNYENQKYKKRTIA